MTNAFIYVWVPLKSAAANGTVALAIAVEAKNAKLAEMKATMLLEEAFPNSTSNFSNPKFALIAKGYHGRPLTNSTLIG